MPNRIPYNAVGCAIFYYFLRMLKVPDHSW